MRDGKRGRIAKRISGERPLRRRPIFVFFCSYFSCSACASRGGAKRRRLYQRLAHALYPVP